MTDRVPWLLSRRAAIVGSVLWGTGVGYAVLSWEPRRGAWLYASLLAYAGALILTTVQSVLATSKAPGDVYSVVVSIGHMELGTAVVEVVIGAFLAQVLFEWAAVPALARYELLLIGAAAALFAGRARGRRRPRPARR